MVITSSLSILALRSMVEGAIDVIEKQTGLPIKDKAEQVFAHLIDHFQDQSGRLTDALTTANHRAWRSLELALAGESLRTLLDRQEDKQLRAQIRAALDANPLNEVVGVDADFRRSCLVELREARRQGQLTEQGPLDPASLFRKASEFARFDDPTRLLDAEWVALQDAAASIRANFPHLARLLNLRGSKGLSPLVVAVRYYFRRAVENDEILFRSVTWGTIDHIGQSQARGFHALDAQARSLESLLGEVREVVVQTHGDVLDIKAEQRRQGGQLGDIYEVLEKISGRYDRLDRRMLQPGDSLSLRTEDERRLVQALVRQFRALPEDRRNELPALLNGLGKLEVVVGELEDAGRDFRTVAATVNDPRARAEAHYNAYLATLERREWAEALDELKQAIDLDGPRFAPYPTDKFESERILGAGGFGVVFLCRNRYSGARVVIKSLLTDDLDREVAGIFAEASVLEELNHPAIIRIRDCGYADSTTRSRPYLILDHFDGQSLDEFIRTHGPIAADALTPLARVVAEALDAAHARGIWHRDVKPANVLIRQDPRGWHVKLIDFGLAHRRVAIERSISRDGSLGRSLAGTSIAGTLDYAAPEQMGKQPGVAVGPHSDVYGFGKTCFFTLFGEPDPDQDEIDDLPDDWRKLLTRCVSKKVEKRPAGFGLILEQYLKDAAVAKSVEKPTPDRSTTTVRDQPTSNPAFEFEDLTPPSIDDDDLAKLISLLPDPIDDDRFGDTDFELTVVPHDSNHDLPSVKADLSSDFALDESDSETFVVDEHEVSIDREGPLPKSATDFIHRGNAFRSIGNFDRAIEDYTEALRIRPNDGYVYINRGLALVSQGKIDLAIADFTQAIHFGPRYDALNHRGNAFETKGEINLAIADYTDAINYENIFDTMKNDNTEAYIHRGIALQLIGEIDRAIADFNEILSSDPNSSQFFQSPRYANAYLHRGIALAAKGETDRAIDDYSQAIRINPKHPDAYYNRGIALKVKGEIDRAYADFEVARRLQEKT